MPPLIFLLDNHAYILGPNGWIGWLGWSALVLVCGLLLRRWWHYHLPLTRARWMLFLLLILLVPVTSLLMPGLQLSTTNGLTPPRLPQEPVIPVVMVFSAVPWMLAGGLLGPGPALILAVMAGLFLAYWQTHSIFLPLEFAIMSLVYTAAVNQRYRTPFFRVVRHPFAAAFGLSLIYPVLSLVGSMLSAQGLLANRLDYASTYLWVMVLAHIISWLVGGLLAEVVAMMLPKLWSTSTNLTPSPAEQSLAARFLFTITPLALIMTVILMAGDWVVAESAARRMLEGRMANAASMAAQSVPALFEAGQGLIQHLAVDYSLDPRNMEVEELSAVLEQHIRLMPFFNQIILLNDQGEPVTSYPPSELRLLQLTAEEKEGVRLALNGVPIQSFAIPPLDGAGSAVLTYVATIESRPGKLNGVLIGRSELAENPYADPLLTSLQSLASIDGEGLLLDETGQILYHHPDVSRLMALYTGVRPETASFHDETASDGTRRLVYFQPVSGTPWSVVLMIPARYAQQQALDIATPLLGMLIILAFIAVLLLRVGLRMVTASLHQLATEATRMAQGKLDVPLRVDGEDEVGQLRRSFEQMRKSLKTRIDELNRLLLVSQGVAGSLEIEASLHPVLEAALFNGAAMARVVLTPAVVPELDGGAGAPFRLGLGPANERYCHLDDQLLALTKQQERIVLSNLSRTRLLTFPAGLARPKALMAVPLRHESLFYGTLWVAYEELHPFGEEEERFMVTLASQAALAAANARLFLTAEVGRKRLEAILASTPDPVLVTDQRNCLLLANPAAWQLFGLDMGVSEGQPIEQAIDHEELIRMLQASSDGKISTELALPNGQTYLATASPVAAEDRWMGRVCVLRDVTHFKELDNLKSEFVSTVSHDLRSPLTLIRGYATMLQMVGELNEQQGGYVRKIIMGVENMSRLVNNLLDLGRIEAGVGLQLEKMPVQDVIDRVIGALQLQAAQRHVYLNVESIQPTIPLLEADQALLQQSLHNLVENAIKYTDAGGRVQVSVTLEKEEVVVPVRDTGIGIAPADQQHLFERFFRAGRKSRSNKREGGSGLGLAIVKSIAERHGGRVWVESQLGKGSTFFLALPLRQIDRAQ